VEGYKLNNGKLNFIKIGWCVVIAIKRFARKYTAVVLPQPRRNVVLVEMSF
jgi:hypothetical protein